MSELVEQLIADADLMETVADTFGEFSAAELRGFAARFREAAAALDSGLPSTTGSFSAEERGIVREKISPAPASQQDEAEMREAIAREYGEREGADECFECGGELSVVCLACDAPPPPVSDPLDKAVTYRALIEALDDVWGERRALADALERSARSSAGETTP